MKFKQASPVANPVSVAASSTCPADLTDTGLGMDGVHRDMHGEAHDSGQAPDSVQVPHVHPTISAEGDGPNPSPSDQPVG